MLNDFDKHNLHNQDDVESDEASAAVVLGGCLTMLMLFALFLILGVVGYIFRGCSSEDKTEEPTESVVVYETNDNSLPVFYEYSAGRGGEGGVNATYAYSNHFRES